jgi:hypothetical protein
MPTRLSASQPATLHVAIVTLLLHVAIATLLLHLALATLLLHLAISTWRGGLGHVHLAIVHFESPAGFKQVN